MAECKSCKKKKSPVNIAANISPIAAVDFSLVSAKTATVRVGNKNLSIMSPLLKIKPPRGYGINLIVKGHKRTITDTSPARIVQSIIELYALNGIELEPKSVWLNANIYWLKQLSIRHGFTTVEELEAISTTEVAKEIVLDDPSPADWGASAWRTLGAYLSQSEVSKEGFISVLEILGEMLTDPFIGCEECADHFDEARISLNTEDLTQLKMAQWMFATMNEIRTSLS